jgi:hypothetical protein
MNGTAKLFEQALRNKNTTLALALLEQDKGLAHRIHRDMYGRRTALHMAVEYGNVGVTERLLALGVKTNVPLRYIDQVHTPASYTRSHNFKNVPNSDKIIAAFSAHYALKATQPTPTPVLGSLRTRAAALFGNAVTKAKKFFAQDAIGLASISTLPAAIGAAIGVGTTAAVASPAVALAAAASLTGYCLHKLADSSLYSGKKDEAERIASRIARAEEFYGMAGLQLSSLNTAAPVAPSPSAKEFVLRIPTSANLIGRGDLIAGYIEHAAQAVESNNWDFRLTRNDGGPDLGRGGINLPGRDLGQACVEIRFEMPEAVGAHGTTAAWEASRLLRAAAEQAMNGLNNGQLLDLSGKPVGTLRMEAAQAPAQAIEPSPVRSMGQAPAFDGPGM